ncbi:flagellar biosynthesis protein FlgE [Salipiger aestuarii]|uniref:Flagellar hook protein FlgE n=1 Tax=Salipiger aestuarii TaxID=568098 RepID=A0A327YKE0_9RHOB|nr:flagellar hook-basal body complex protein [Salipiger aestuarii]EIE52605.1 flagellar hook protein FlgE [Citreicella sp. 357]KAA8609841.1 flagellar biosynthesis protein FlgE [Salipiger aestuarii]KAA8616153.1 flagellar biosynthesis protein FlgE [Salipiger aestuarii]KAB2543101.1 flagellar biosynthesis protein FlgE [Salipiger aestuarii]RAK21413.1 flagellar hook protein FlgE [Salipiger aestuarii]
MTISSSLNAGVSGLAGNATRLAAISDNIANSSTYGYRRVETDFTALVMSSGASTYTAGGTKVDNLRLIDEGGALVSTSNATDLAIDGLGMLPVVSSSRFEATGEPELLLTSTGSFRIDENGYLASESGYYLMGWPANLDGSIPNYPRDTINGLEPIQFSLSLTGDPTTSINMALNLPATSTQAGATAETEYLEIEYFDNVGISQSVSITFTPTVPATGTSNEWTMLMTDSAQDGATIGEYTITFDNTTGDGGTISSVAAGATGGAYDATTGMFTVDAAGGPIEFDIGAVGKTGGLSQLGDSFAPIAISKDGSSVGNMVSVEVDENGYVSALYDSGQSQVLYQIPLADLPNYNGMIAVDGSTFRPSPESGSFFLWDAGDGPTGSVKSYARQESATDIAQELTDMIRTQRAYSSNAKVIQTVDEMLQETTNMKR